MTGRVSRYGKANRIRKQRVSLRVGSLLFYNSTGTRAGLIAELTQMRGYLDDEDGDLQELTDSVIGKLEAMTDEAFQMLDLISDYDI